ncbi:tubulin-specific chaperone cofactor E-like protein [Watersipora subatra]|uniref:tubulin-specific chaperone cofactor E-like protein n=1 Tax=Watersipora subatra TaxID=2589382 RepID=UPI00355BDBCA
MRTAKWIKQVHPTLSAVHSLYLVHDKVTDSSALAQHDLGSLSIVCGGRMESSSKEMHSVSLVSALKEKYSTFSLDSLHCEIFITSKAPDKTGKPLVISGEDVMEQVLALYSLEKLYLSGNLYKGVTLDLPAYDTLRLLQLTDNNISSWRDVQRLDELFPRLKTLVLALNNISSCGSLEGNASIFSHLSVLNMNNTAISEWDELYKLSAINSLSDIRLFSIPLVEAYDEIKRRQMILVYFAHASRLNGSGINTVEMDAAERVYIRHFQDASHKPCRYSELQAKRGILDSSASVTLQPADTVAMTVIVDDKRAVFDIPTKQTIDETGGRSSLAVSYGRHHLFDVL